MIKFSECGLEGYPARTRTNIISSDITIAFADDFSTAGEKLTKSLCKKYKRTYIQIPLGKFNSEQASTIITLGIGFDNLFKQNKIINIAGNGIYSLDYTQQELNVYLEDVLHYVKLSLESCNENILLIRSGGQTGIDEAGVVAANRLGIPTLVFAPKGWMFRNKEGKDIRNEKLFKQRFYE